MVFTILLPPTVLTKKYPATFTFFIKTTLFTAKSRLGEIFIDNPHPTPASFGVETIWLSIPDWVKISLKATTIDLERTATITYSINAFSFA